LELAGGGWGLDLDLEAEADLEVVEVDAVELGGSGHVADGHVAAAVTSVKDDAHMGDVLDLVNGEPNWTSSNT
jgi:hypothetical protein